MATVGRNQPCPCGSGRKYKQCCGPKERARQVRQAMRHREDDWLWLALLSYLDRPGLYVDSQSAFSRFWNGDFDLRVAKALDEQAMQAFLEWYAYDYASSKDRQRIVDRFAADEGARLTAEQRELLEEHRASHLSLHAIEEATAEGSLRIADLLLGGLYQVEDAGLARLARPGDLLLGRRFGGEVRGWSMSRGTALLPAALRAGLVGVAERAFALYSEEHYGATRPQCLREVGYVMFHYLLSPEAAAVYDCTPRREGYFDPRASVQAMHELKRRLAEEEARQEEAAGASREEPKDLPLVERTDGGILIPGQPRSPVEGQGGILLPGQLR